VRNESVTGVGSGRHGGSRKVSSVRRRIALAQVFTHREPALLVSGQAVSSFGDGVANIALTILVLDTTHSASRLAWFAAARMVPTVAFLLIGGAIVDRVSRRLLLLASDASRALLTGGLVALIVAHQLTFTDLLLFAVAFGCFDALFMPAISAITPEIVPEDLLPAMNAVRPLSGQLVGNMIGPAVGGLILAAWSTAWALGIDAGTFVVSAGAIALMRPTPTPSRHEETTVWRDIREGLGYVRRTSWIWTTLTAVTFTNALVLTPSFVLVAFYLRHDLHTSKEALGFAFAAMGASGALGALVAGSRRTPRRRVRTAWAYWTVCTGSAFIFAVSTNFWEAVAFPVICSPFIVLGNVVWETLMQEEIPRELLGRVSSVDWFVSLGLSPVGLVVAGSLATVMGVRAYFGVMAAITIVPGLLIIASRKVNAVDAARVSAGRGGALAPGAPAPSESPS
jgi:MFS family permease